MQNVQRNPGRRLGGCAPNARLARRSPLRRVLQRLVLPLALSACAGAQPQAIEPAAQGPAAPSAASCQALYPRYLATLPARFKMRHQVSATVGPRSEVIEGLLVMERPRRFRVRAMGALGTPLFDVRSETDKPPQVEVWLEALGDPRLPHYLARDIRRIYVLQCPASTPAAPRGSGCEARCRLAPETPLPSSGAAPHTGDDDDEGLRMHLSAAGLLTSKTYFRAGQPVARVSYSGHRSVDGVWIAHRIDLEHVSPPYSIALALLDADLSYDTARAFPRDPS